MMLHWIFKDPVLLSQLEADFIQYYNLDIYSFLRGEIYCRRMCELVMNLPEGSRVAKKLRNDPLNTQDHLLMTLVDGINFLNFQNYYIAAGAIGKDYKKILAKAPKSMKRPTYDKEEAKPKKVFVSGRDLKQMMGGTKLVIEHTRSCISSRINEGGGELRCDCPSRQPKSTGEV